VWLCRPLTRVCSPSLSLARSSARARPLCSAWCAYELYKAVVDCLHGFKHHIVTATGGERDKKAVCLLDGFAQGDREDSQLKAMREAAFPQELLAKSHGHR
jgi:hypothetical protein